MGKYEILDQHVEHNYFEDSREKIKMELLEPLRKDEMKNLLKTRKISEPGSTNREDYERDYTRILYSHSFRRLQGKMQLLAIQNDKFFRNRLTHSLEVSQIARAIAREIGYNISELYVVEAGALAHDIGNPPFGHFGESVLHNLAMDIGGYEGNAQTFRILTRLEKKMRHDGGLNLTYRTLLSVLKYNKTMKMCEEQKEKYKFIYDESFRFVEEIKAHTGVKLRTLDVQIVDIADEIAYAAHDLEDGLSQGLFTIDEILFEFQKKYLVEVENENKYINNFLIQIVEKSKEWASTYAQTAAEYTSLFNNKLSSLITYHLIRDLSIIKLDKKRQYSNSEYSHELGFKTLSKLAEGLKDITFNCVCQTDKVYYYEQAGENIIKSLFDLYYNNLQFLPNEYRIEESKDYLNLRKKIKNYKENNINEIATGEKETLDKYERKHKRNIIDYISGMMDSYAINEYYRFFGKKPLQGIFDIPK